MAESTDPILSHGYLMSIKLDALQHPSERRVPDLQTGEVWRWAVVQYRYSDPWRWRKAFLLSAFHRPQKLPPACEICWQEMAMVINEPF
jgi:hypothetical protein